LTTLPSFMTTTMFVVDERTVVEQVKGHKILLPPRNATGS